MIIAIQAYLARLLAAFANPTSYGSQLESYITSKNPQSVTDVEYFTRQYDQRRSY